jgi:1-deoxy-D-xylulose-5-phosphate reductoisomerase
MPNLTILGSTGTIGVNTLDVVSRLGSQLEIFALTANSNVATLAEQCRVWKPSYAVLTSEAAADELRKLIKDDSPDTEVLFGVEGLSWVSGHDKGRLRYVWDRGGPPD